MYWYKCPSVIIVSLYISSVLLEKINKDKGCFYKGSFHHGNWTDGCDFNCTCLDTRRGHYKCHTRCPVYPQLPKGCVLKLPEGQECCKQPDCSAVTVAYTIINSNNSSNDNGNGYDNGKLNGNSNDYDYGNMNGNSNGNDYGNINGNTNGYDNGNIDSNSNGDNGNYNGDDTNSTNYIDNGSSMNTSFAENGEGNGCYYKARYHYGNWTDGCEFNCTCEDPVLGIYRCHKRCENYTDLDPGCVLKLSTTDDCCKVSECNTSYLTSNKGDNKNDTDINTIDNNKTINFQNHKISIPSTTLPPIFVRFFKTTTSPIVNHYSNVVASDNKTETRNINYNIVTETNTVNEKDKVEVFNATETEKLAIIFSRFGPFRLFTVGKDNTVESIGATEVLSKHQNDTQKSDKGFDDGINSQRQSFTVSGETGADVEGKGKVCNYKGRNFTQDEQWYDGCDFKCECENATRGLYKCRSRCPSYKDLPFRCVMRRSRKDTCCVIPDCRYATVVNRNNELTIQKLIRSDMSMLKRMFNYRHKTRKEPSQSANVYTNGMKQVQIPPIDTKDKSVIDRRKHQNTNGIMERTNSYNKYLQTDNRHADNIKQEINERIRNGNRLIIKQEIVTPFSVSRSDSNSKSVHKETPQQRTNMKRNKSFRTIATETGIYKVRKKDGAILSHKEPVSKEFSEMIRVTIPGKSRRGINNKSGHCQYKDRRYAEGETWFDGCELLCYCQDNGQYICHQRCPEYSRIPNGCALVPPGVGQCCALLVCRQMPTRNNPPSSYMNL